jgi:hypothetical protein
MVFPHYKKDYKPLKSGRKSSRSGALKVSFMMNKVRRLILYAVGIFALRKDDVLLSSYPRSGSTWVRFMLANYISLKHLGGILVTFPLLDRLMPELGASNLVKAWPYSECPRVVKTHRRYLGLYGKCSSIGILRDPRDVMVSYYHFLTERERPRYIGDFQGFLRCPKFGLEAWFRHTVSWLPHWNLMIHFEALKREPKDEFERVLKWLGIDLEHKHLNALIARSERQSVAKSEKGAPPERFKTDRKFRFIRNNGSKGWTEYFTKRDLIYFGELKRRYDIRLYE